MQAHRDAFGRLLVSPERLTRCERVDELARLAGRLQADAALEVRWLGSCLQAWLERGGSFDEVLGIRAPHRSRATPVALVHRAEASRLLLALSAAAGGDARARAVLAGTAPCPPAAQDVLQRLRSLRAPTSKAAFTRAKVSRLGA